MNKLNDMADLSWTQTARAMSSLPLNRAERVYKPIWQIAEENNEKPKRLRVTKCKNPAVLWGVDIVRTYMCYRCRGHYSKECFTIEAINCYHARWCIKCELTPIGKITR